MKTYAFGCIWQAERWRQTTPGLCGATVVIEFDHSVETRRFKAKLRQARIAAPQAARNLPGWQ